MSSSTQPNRSVGLVLLAGVVPLHECIPTHSNQRALIAPFLFISCLNSAQNTDLNLPKLAVNPGKLCWTNRNVITGTAIGSTYAIADWQGSSYRCGEDCATTNGCVGYQFQFTDIYTGEGQCTLYSGLTVVNRGLVTNVNVYVLDGIYCPTIADSF